MVVVVCVCVCVCVGGGGGGGGGSIAHLEKTSKFIILHSGTEMIMQQNVSLLANVHVA